MLRLRHATPAAWLPLVRERLDAFLQDHAANERKVSQSALKLVTQHPRETALAGPLIALAQEELAHFRRVFEILRGRGRTLAPDAPDPYMGALNRAVRQPDVEAYLLDRLVLFAIVEARGCERFAMLADGLDPGPLRDFYAELTRAEARHHATYLALARRRFPEARVASRLDALLDLEAEVARGLPLRPALH